MECNVKIKGQLLTATVLMDFNVKLCDACGNCYGKEVLQDFQVTQQLRLQPISINWLVKDGFTLLGNGNTLALVHTNNK